MWQCVLFYKEILSFTSKAEARFCYAPVSALCGLKGMTPVSISQQNAPRRNAPRSLGLHTSARILVVDNEISGIFGVFTNGRKAGRHVFLSRRLKIFWGSLWLNDYLTTYPSCSLISCGEVLLVMADLTTNCWFFGPESWGEVLLVMAQRGN